MKKSQAILIITGLFLTSLMAQAQDANYDESLVDSYILPDAMTALNGQQITKKKQWEKTRRPQILKLFQDNEYGIMPDAKIRTDYRILEESGEALGGKAIRRQVEITFRGNNQSRKMLVLIYMPKGIKKCPVFVSPNFQGNATTSDDPAVIESQYSTYGRGHQTSRWSFDRIVSSGYAIATFHYYDIYFDQNDKISESIYPLFVQLAFLFQHHD